MSGLRSALILLDSPREVFYPGQAVLGSVVFEIEQPFQLSVVFVDYIGVAAVDWTERESQEYNGVTRYRNVEYVGREEYFNVRQVLAGGSGASSFADLPPGTHTYQFNFQVPPGVPSSYSGARGRVSYCIKATIDLRGREPLNREITKNFDVVAPFDLNFGSAQLKEPIELEFEEDVGCGCFGGSPLVVRARTPVSGYCPGQVVPVGLEVDNQSNVEVRNITLQILTRERYVTQRPVSEYIPPERVLETVHRGPVMSGSKRHLTVEIKVPDLLAPNLENCKIIDVGYFIKVTIQLSGCNEDLTDEAEFCIGLLPLDQTVDGEYTHPLSQSLPIGPIPVIPSEEQRPAGYQQSNPAPPPGPLPEFMTNQGAPNGGQFTFSTSDDGTIKTSFVQMREMSYNTADPSQNYTVTMSSKNGQPMTVTNQTRDFPLQDLKINLPEFGKDMHISIPQFGIDINMPSMPAMPTMPNMPTAPGHNAPGYYSNANSAPSAPPPSS